MLLHLTKKKCSEGIEHPGYHIDVDDVKSCYDESNINNENILPYIDAMK
jgi:hypothetical protein